ncbi:hypothetical protein PIB30_028374 [Stylosanthes scabra]|uniref:Uncharacterized protein n=1 Tax=Stylosanthes scabra TaxID=79078 RepID=A0ABU6SBE9_9FABA|nr:hypothetical protein [Stylosanthes scabra]
MATTNKEMQKHKKEWCSHCVIFTEVLHAVNDKYWSNSCGQCGKILSDSSILDSQISVRIEEIRRMMFRNSCGRRRKKKIVVHNKQNHDDTEQEEKEQETEIKSNDDGMEIVL